MPGFLPLSVFEKRAEDIRRYLAEEGLSALAVFSPENLTYVSGFFLDVAPWERPVVAVIPLEADPFMVLCELSTNHVLGVIEDGLCYIKDVRLYTEHPRLTDRVYTVVQWNDLVKSVFREKRITRGKVAVDSLSSWARLQSSFPDVKAVPTDIVRELRYVKCPEELELIRLSGELSDWGQERFLEALGAGEVALEVGARVTHQLTVEAIKRWPEANIQVIRAGGHAGRSSGCPHRLPTNLGRKIEKGDSLVNGVVVRINGYGVENERTFIFGEPTKEQERLFRVMTEAQEAAVEVCVEGRKVSDIDSVAQAVIEKAGYGGYIMHRTGHGIGLGGHEYPDDTAFNPRPLLAGVVMSVEPGLYVKDMGGFRHSDTVIVGKTSPENTTNFTKRLEDLVVPG